MTWRVVFTAQAQADARRIAAAGLRPDAQRLLDLLQRDPRGTPPPWVPLTGDLQGALVRRLSIQHRLVCQAFDKERTVRVLRMWTYGR